MNSGIARTPAEHAAFAALNAHQLDEAQKRFTALLEQDPNNGRAAAGMGFLRMQQNNFGGAISYLTQAEQNGYKARTVEDGLATSRFWYTMGEAPQAFDENQFDVAAAKYPSRWPCVRAAPRLSSGLAGLLTKQQHYSAAAASTSSWSRSSRARRRPGADSSLPTRATTRTRRRWPSRAVCPARSRPL